MPSNKESLRTPSALGRKTNRFRSRSLEAAAVGIATAGYADNASAVVIWDSAVNTSVGSTFSIDGTVLGEVVAMSGMGGMAGDLFLNVIAGMMGGIGSTVELSVFDGGGMNDFLSAYDIGDTVDGSLSFDTRGYMKDDPDNNPQWNPGETWYAGFTYDLGGGPLYGWLKIEFDLTGTDFTVLESAYESSGGSIAVGQVPEPSTGLLLGLGLAGLGALARKRSRSRLAKVAT